MPYNLKLLDRFPEEPGVYLMKNTQSQIIYVGKAKHLKKRVKQYFVEGQDLRAMIPFLRKEIEHIETIVVTTEKEALLLENTLIKKHQPKYNACLKDDKTFISLMINIEHYWPKLSLVRYKGKPKQKGLYFGPYTNAFAARQTFELLSRLFPLRQCSDEELKRRTRPCLLHGMKRCLAPCVEFCTKQEYTVFVESTIQFLKGKDQEILQLLYKEMHKASDLLEFEKAATLLHTIRQIEHVTQTSQIVEKTNIKNSDCLGLFRQADEVILMQLFIREGKLTGSAHFSFANCLEEDQELLTSFILQYYRQNKELPEEILLPVPLDNTEELTEILFEFHQQKIAFITPEKGRKKNLVLLAEKNAKTTFTQEKDENELKEKMLLDLSEKLNLSRFPRRIECFDTSNIAGSDKVASMVTFTNGEYDKKRTRYYKIKDLERVDDYAALYQVLSRRLTKAKEEDDLPDLVLIDGGKGHLSIGIQVFKELNIASVDLAAISKEESKHTKGMTAEKIFVLDQQDPITLHINSPLLFLLQRIRDAAHEKAIGFHRKLRSKRTIGSALANIEGIGPIKQKRLLMHFKSLKKIHAATDTQLLEIKGITKKDIASIRKDGQKSDA